VAKDKQVARSKKKTTSKKKPNAIQRFYRETMGELRKVTWPTRKEAVNLTIVVLIVTFSMSAFLGLLDLIFGRLFALLIGG
jgi:preprotein translocase subunit SecE